MERILVLLLLAASLAGCGGGSSSAAPPAEPPPPPPPPGPAPATVALSGQVTFDFVPAVAGRGLDYAATEARPARGVTVELLTGGTVTSSTATDASGNYSFNVPASTDVSLRVRAEMIRVGSPSWDFRVVDNVSGNALYTLAGTVFNTGEANLTRNLHAPSGWDGSAYAATRSAAPFAILDVVYDAVQLILTAAPSTPFPALQLNWSTQNVPVTGTQPGEIGSSRFRSDLGIFLVGAANQDTDEYDRHVIAHEFGHYLEYRFSRSDSIGGPHTLTDQLDMRLAFGEAWGNSFAAMVTGQPVYVDAFGAAQARSFSFNLEQSPTRMNPNPGWFNEEAVQSLLFDLYDNGRDVPPGSIVVDDLALGFAPIWTVLTGEQRTTRALTSVFSLVHALKTARAGDAPLIDTLTNTQRIAAVTDPYGTGQTNFGVATQQRSQQEVGQDFNTIYDSLTVGGSAVNVCSLTDYTSALTGAENKLASRRYVRFTVTAPGSHTITASAVSPINAAADPDMRLHLGSGQIIESDGPRPPLCSTSLPQNCLETFTATLQGGDHVLEIYEWTNTNATSDEEPPIGRTCFDVTVTR
jgi:hypothetical protein